MSAFRFEEPGHELKFSNPSLAGLKIRVREASVGEVVKLQRLANGQAGSDEEMFQMLADAVLEWNLIGRDDKPVPNTLEGIYTLPVKFVGEVIRAWCEALAGIDAPLGEGSNSGDKSLAASLPMALPSESQAS